MPRTVDDRQIRERAVQMIKAAYVAVCVVIIMEVLTLAIIANEDYLCRAFPPDQLNKVVAAERVLQVDRLSRIGAERYQCARSSVSAGIDFHIRIGQRFHSLVAVVPPPAIIECVEYVAVGRDFIPLIACSEPVTFCAAMLNVLDG